MKLVEPYLTAWEIHPKKEKLFSEEYLAKMLNKYNRTSKCDFFIANYYKRSFVFDPLETVSVIGFPRQTVMHLGFDFYKKFLSPKTYKWFVETTANAWKIFYKYPLKDREGLTFSHTMPCRTAKGNKIVIEHTLVPYELDINGNMWLGLCHVRALPTAYDLHETYIIHRRKGERYDLVDGKYRLSDEEILTDEEIQYLQLIAMDFNEDELCERFDICKRTLSRKMKRIFHKLSVKTPAAAVYRAITMKLIQVS